MTYYIKGDEPKSMTDKGFKYDPKTGMYVLSLDNKTSKKKEEKNGGKRK